MCVRALGARTPRLLGETTTDPARLPSTPYPPSTYPTPPRRVPMGCVGGPPREERRGDRVYRPRKSFLGTKKTAQALRRVPPRQMPVVDLRAGGSMARRSIPS